MANLSTLVRYNVKKLHNSTGSIEKDTKQKQSEVKVDEIILDHDAVPCPKKLNALIENHDKFNNTWSNQRPDLPSPSEYHQSIASIAVYAGWNDQEIADAIIAWQRTWNNANIQKVMRPDYVKRTIAKARLSVSIESDVDRVEKSDNLSSEKKQRYLEIIAEALGSSVSRVLRQGNENTQYSIIVLDERGNEREVVIGSSSDLLSITKFRAKMFNVTGIAIPPMKPRPWYRLCQFLFRLSDVIEDDAASEVEMAKEWLEQFFDDRLYSCNINDEDQTSDQWEYHLTQNNPFKRNGNICVHASEFLRFIRFCIQHKNYELRDVTRVLRRMGFTQEKINAVYNDRNYCRRYWVIPLHQYKSRRQKRL
ncbi:MAG: hypothetical protein JW860_02605 [Sedimentisphaerales bacterium]|nr:hypothetical protein [Sedimentisphaerales bacterium]